MGALSRQADMVTAIHFVAMRKQPDSGSLAAANSGIQHGYPPQWIRAVQPLWPPAGMEATACHEEICGHLRISRASGRVGALTPLQSAVQQNRSLSPLYSIVEYPTRIRVLSEHRESKDLNAALTPLHSAARQNRFLSPL